MMKDSEEKQSQDKEEYDSECEKEQSKKPAKKTKGKTPAKPRIKPSFYYVSSSEDEADILKDRFWKDLEDGKVDIFRTADLYSTVKAIGRTARPKSLAESDLRKSGLRSASNQQKETDEKEAKTKGGKRKKAAPKTRKKTAGRKRSGAAVKSSSPVKNSDNEAEFSSGGEEIEEMEYMKKKTKKKTEELDEESEFSEDEDTVQKVKAKTKVKRKKNNKRKENEDEEEDEEDDEEIDEKLETKVKARKKKQKKTKKSERKEGDEDEEETEDEVEGSKKMKKKRKSEVMKEVRKGKKEVKIGNDDEVDEELDETEESDEEAEKKTKDETLRPIQKDKKKDGEDDEEEEEEAEHEEAEHEEENEPEEDVKKDVVVKDSEKKPKKELQPKVAVVSRAVVSRHMVEAIDRVIAESAAMWREKYGNDDDEDHFEKETFKTVTVEEEEEEEEDPGGTETADDKEYDTGATAAVVNSENKNKKRKRQEDEEEGGESESPRQSSGIKTTSKTKKIVVGQIDYFSEEDPERETKTSRKNRKRARQNVSDVQSLSERVDEMIAYEHDEAKLDSYNYESIELATLSREDWSSRESADSNIQSSVGKAEGESLEETADAKSSQTTDEKDSPSSGDVVEEKNFDHLVFNLETVESVLPEEVIDAYAEWNIKALTNEDLYKAVKFNNFNLVQAMMREAHQFDLEQMDPATGSTLTITATQNYSMEIVELLVLNGANVNARMKNGHSALTLACDKGLHCAVSLLLCLNADINCQLPTGETPLILAVKKNHYHVVRILLEHGVNIGAAAVGDRHALSLARQLGHQPITELLTSHKLHLTSELFQQVSMVFEGSAKVSASVFPIQCFRLCDGNRFVVDFRHELQPTQTNRGMLLFLGHGHGSASDVQVRLYGSCAVTKAVLNNVTLQPLNEENFVLTFCPLRDGHNQLEIFTIPLNRSTYKVHLIVAAFAVTLL